MKKGFALITVLAILIIIGFGSLAILKAVTSHSVLKTTNINEIKAQYLAEAGMQHALWRCRTTGCQNETLTIEGSSVAITQSGANPVQLKVTVNYT